MLEVLRVVQSRLSETGYNSFFYEKNKETGYPFVIFNFPNSNIEEYREDFILEVDIWTKDQTQCYEMADTIDKKLNRYKYIDDNTQLSIYRINRLNNIPDEDKKVRRNQLRYLVKTYFKN